jgi:coenzyme Q-binding protein COQ10
MPTHRESRKLAYSPEQLFDLVADVSSYPKFLPWVAATRIRERSDAQLIADMSVGFGPFRETFRSKVTLDRPGHLHVDYLSGPLKYLNNDWRFRAVEGGTIIDFAVAFEFKQKILEAAAGAFFNEAFRRMVTAFERRACQVYGQGNCPPSVAVPIPEAAPAGR